MSYNPPYRNPQGDKDARIYTRDSSAYRSGIRSTTPHRTSSSSSEQPVFPPNKALSFLHSCGLDAEDLQTLAKLPEHLITTDTLPDLLTEIKKKKLSHTSSPRSSVLPAASSARSWDDRSHAQSVEYPLDLPARQSYSLNREQAQTWDDNWGDVQQTSSPAASSYVVEYNHLKEKKSYYDEPSYPPEPSREMSYSNYGKEVGHSSHFSSRDASHSSHLSSRDSQSSRRSSRDLGQTSQHSSRYISQSSVRSSRDVAPSSHLSSRDVGVHSHIAQPSPMSNRNVGIPSLLSIRDLAPASHLSSRAVRQPSWKKGSAPRVPTRKEASDFHGRTPPVFPYACVLCEITVLSDKDWSVHINGPQHANSQLSLVEKYPAWDQTIHSARRNEPESERPKHGTIQARDRISSQKIGPSGSRSGASTSRSAPTSRRKQNKIEPPSKCKVVCVKFENNEVDETYLKHLLGQFGAIVKIIMFPNLALAEMGTMGQAEDIVKYFSQNPLRFKGKKLEFSLSAAFSFLQGSRVVSFSPIPSGEGVSSELMAIAKRFGSVIQSQFLPHRGYVEMALVEEASKLVDHYSTNSLKLKGKTITVAFSTEYQTLSDLETDKYKLPAHQSSNRRRERRSYSPRRRSSQRDSPSPKRRASEEGSHPSQGHDAKKREESRRSREDSSSKSHSKNGSPSRDLVVKTEEEEGEGEMVEEDNQSDNMDEGSDLEGLAVIADDGEELNTEDEYTVDEDLDDEALDTSDALIDAPEDMQTVSESSQTVPSDMNTSDIQPATTEGEPNAIISERSNEEGNEEAQEPQQGEQKELQEEKEPPREEQKGEQKEELNQEEQIEELKQDEQKEDLQPEDKKEELQEVEHKESQDKENEQNNETMTVEEEAADSSENLENALTEQGDENKISALETEEQYGRVLEVAGFPVAKKYSEADLLKIGEKYGDVAGCCLVRSNRKVEKALIEMVNADDAAKLEADCKKQHIKLGGKILRIKVSQKYSQVNEGNDVDPEPAKVEGNDLVNVEDATLNFEDKNTEPTCSVAPIEESTVLMSETETTEEPDTPMETNTDSITQTSSDEEEGYGRVIRVRHLPVSDEYTDADFLNIAKPYGTVIRHWMFRLHRTGLIEMETASDAEKVLSAAKMKKITVAGKHPKIAVSTKHANLNKRYFLYQSELEKTKDESSTQNDEKQVSEADNGTGTQAETQTLLMDPVGMEFVRPVVGYFCNLCNAIYASEEEAKGEHCRTPLHHQKLKEHNEQNGSK